MESAINRPQTLAHYEGADLLTQGVVLMLAISQAQAFVDGNKRTALTVGLVFLRVNGLVFHGDSELLAALIEEAAEQSESEGREKIIAWMQGQIRPALTADEAAAAAEAWGEQALAQCRLAQEFVEGPQRNQAQDADTP